MYISTYCYRKP